MEISAPASQIIFSQIQATDLKGSRISESGLKNALEKTRQAADAQTFDRFDIRNSVLRSGQARLREIHGLLEEGQAKLTVHQIAGNALSKIKSLVEEIQDLATAAQEGVYSSEQLEELRGMVNQRLAIINEIAGGTRFRGQALFTGQSERFETDPLTRKGFDVLFPGIDTSALGLGSVDLTTDENLAASAEALTGALGAIATAQSGIETQVGSLDVSVGSLVEDLGTAFSDLASHEKLTAPDETRWLKGNEPEPVSTETLRSVISSSLVVQPEMVATYLR
jgi:flagellin-like hook-associated protein FlgL